VEAACTSADRGVAGNAASDRLSPGCAIPRPGNPILRSGRPARAGTTGGRFWSLRPRSRGVPCRLRLRGGLAGGFTRERGRDFAVILAQHLAFEEIKYIPDPAVRAAAEEVKRQDLLGQTGVVYVEYNCIAGVAGAQEASRAVEGAASLLPASASCGDCGKHVADRAWKVIADGSDYEGRDTFNATLEAVRSASTGDANVASASEIELDEESVPDRGSTTDGNDADDVSEDAAAESKGSGTGETEKKATAGKSSSEDTDAEMEEDTSIGSGTEPVSGKNAAAKRKARESNGSGRRVLILGAGALLLVAGVFVARRIF
jgi:hypothetical protein